MKPKKSKAFEADIINELLDDTKDHPHPESAVGGKPPESDRTVKISESGPREDKPPSWKEQIKAAVGILNPKSGAPQAGNPLAHSESLRIAQGKILDLEKEVDRLRLENEQLAAAGETLRQQADERLSRVERLSSKYEQLVEATKEEKEVLLQSLRAKDKVVDELRRKIEELESRLSNSIQKVRVRERELENRLELSRMENSALLRSKDEIILDLKRQMDQLNHELENFRTKGSELNRQVSDKEEMMKRTVKALRIALSMLEGQDDVGTPLRKVK